MRIADLASFNAVREAGMAKLTPDRPRVAVGMGTCGSGNELSASGTTCICTSPGHIIRACIGVNANWGGVNTATCSAPTQTMTAVFR